MTRGRPPHKTLREAEAIALRRGAVIMVPGSRSDAFDLIICEEHRTVFVRFRRSEEPFANLLDILRKYPRDVGRIHRLPLTEVTAREFWLRLKNGKWQFFLIRHDSIVEIQVDGTDIPRVDLPVVVVEADEGFTTEGKE
jgi:hypothetical protein